MAKFLVQKGKYITISEEKLKEVEEIEDISKIYKDNDDRKSNSGQI